MNLHLFKCYPSLFAASCLAVLLLQACQKNNEGPAKQIQPDPALVINFTQNLPAQNIDSVTVLFTRAGKPDSVYQKMDVNGNMATLTTTGLPAAEWNIQPLVYTKQQPDGSYRVYRLATALPPGGQTLTLTGPAGKQTDSWLPAIMLKDSQYNITLLMAERPDDPYLEIRIPPSAKNIQGVFVDRVLWKDGRNDGDDYLGWYLSFNCFTAKGRVTDTNYYKNYCNRIKNKPWDFMDFALVVYDGQLPGGNKLLLYYKADKRP